MTRRQLADRAAMLFTVALLIAATVDWTFANLPWAIPIWLCVRCGVACIMAKPSDEKPDDSWWSEP